MPDVFASIRDAKRNIRSAEDIRAQARRLLQEVRARRIERNLIRAYARGAPRAEAERLAAASAYGEAMLRERQSTEHENHS